MKFPNKVDISSNLGICTLVATVIIAVGFSIAVAKSNSISIVVDSLGLNFNVSDTSKIENNKGQTTLPDERI